ncbi:5'-3' exoribonuclease 1 [Porphyridium purpureum]|uniref:5'-3' exoribonuclease 1 n=1 Tax=Porphyridium purpureum TaxID=35688 RepID=A0A5J4Z3E8_PORPP|nr:5'-3' exoribonuclease 1 [Porphyridium purpureum]|eukprot:POR9011..scf208_2
MHCTAVSHWQRNMGVPKFYRWIAERYPLITRDIKNGEATPVIDNLYLDMNGIIHNCARPEAATGRKLEQHDIFLAVFRYLEMLFALTTPRKVLYMAIDGVAPRAKMNQQRSRRFRSAQERAEEFARLIKIGEIEPDAQQTAEIFDSNCITPGTKFMTELTEALRYFVAKKVSEDRAWARIEVILSGAEAPGEGEHKIMEYIRHCKAAGELDANTAHCLYGLDADLIMLSLVTHEPNFVLLREKVEFKPPRKTSRKLVIESPIQSLVYGEFQFLSIGLLREYLWLEFGDVRAQMPDVELERVVDDFVFMCFLVGNDFLPHIPSLDIKEGALGVIMRLYKHLLPRFGTYLTDCGTINWDMFEIFVTRLGLLEAKVIAGRSGQRGGGKGRGARGGFGGRGGQPLTLDDQKHSAQHDAMWGFLPLSVAPSKKLNPFENEDEDDEDDELEMNSVTGSITDDADIDNASAARADMDADTQRPLLWNEEQLASELAEATEASARDDGFQTRKREYYKSKLDFDSDSETGQAQITALKRSFIEGIQWVLSYYFEGVISWRWFYPYHYAPWASDLVGLASLAKQISFPEGPPFLPLQQLLSVLPAASAWCLPKPYQNLITDPSSPLADFFPASFAIDMNGKKNTWEAVVLLPFIDEQRLVQATEGIDAHAGLTEAERARNMMGVAKLCCRVSSNAGGLDPSVIAVTSAFANVLPPIQVNRCKERDFVLPTASASSGAGVGRVCFGGRLAEGYVPVHQLDAVCFSDHPSLKRRPFTSRKAFAQINLFGMPSRGESVVIQLGDDAWHAPDYDAPPQALNGGGMDIMDSTTNGGMKGAGNGPSVQNGLFAWEHSAEAAVAHGIAPGEIVVASYPWRALAKVISVRDYDREYVLEPTGKDGADTVRMIPSLAESEDTRLDSGGAGFKAKSALKQGGATNHRGEEFDTLSMQLADAFMTQRGLSFGPPLVTVDVVFANSRDPATREARSFEPVSAAGAVTKLPVQLVAKKPPPQTPAVSALANGSRARQMSVLDTRGVLPGDYVLCLSNGPFYGCRGEIMAESEKSDKPGKAHHGRKNLATADEAMLRLHFDVPQFLAREFSFARQVVAAECNPRSAQTVAAVARTLGVSPKLVSRLLGSAVVSWPPPRVGEDLDVGLGVRFVGKNLVVPGYCKMVNNQIMCLPPVVYALKEYITHFDELVRAVEATEDTSGSGAPANMDWRLISPDEKVATAVLKGVKGWLARLGVSKLPMVAASSDVVSRHGVRLLEKNVQMWKTHVQNIQDQLEAKTYKLRLTPDQRSQELTVTSKRVLFGNESDAEILAMLGRAPSVQVGDRVVNRLSSGYAVPLGLRGTVIGVRGVTAGSASGGRNDSNVEVVFDEAFLGGNDLHGRCAPCRGAAVAESSLIRIAPITKSLEDELRVRIELDPDEDFKERNTYLAAVRDSIARLRQEASRARARQASGASSTAAARSTADRRTTPAEVSPFVDPGQLPMPSMFMTGGISAPPPGGMMPPHPQFYVPGTVPSIESIESSMLAGHRAPPSTVPSAPRVVPYVGGPNAMMTGMVMPPSAVTMTASELERMSLNPPPPHQAPPAAALPLSSSPPVPRDTHADEAAASTLMAMLNPQQTQLERDRVQGKSAPVAESAKVAPGIMQTFLSALQDDSSAGPADGERKSDLAGAAVAKQIAAPAQDGSGRTKKKEKGEKKNESTAGAGAKKAVGAETEPSAVGSGSASTRTKVSSRGVDRNPKRPQTSPSTAGAGSGTGSNAPKVTVKPETGQKKSTAPARSTKKKQGTPATSSAGSAGVDARVDLDDEANLWQSMQGSR